MKNESTLDHLLKIEAEAAALVDGAQAEADRRISENEEKNRASFEETFRVQTQRCETLLKEENDRLKQQYRQSLDDYRSEISALQVNTKSFTSLLNKYITSEG